MPRFSPLSPHQRLLAPVWAVAPRGPVPRSLALLLPLDGVRTHIQRRVPKSALLWVEKGGPRVSSETSKLNSRKEETSGRCVSLQKGLSRATKMCDSLEETDKNSSSGGR